MIDPTVEPTLIDKVDELSHKLDQAIDAVDRETQSRIREAEALRLKFFTARRAMFMAAGAVTIVVALVLVLFVARWVDDRHQEEARVDLLVASCVNTNKARVANQARFEQAGALLFDALAEINPPASPEDAARIRGLLDKVTGIYVQKLRDTTPVEAQQRNCSEEAVTTPTIVGAATTG